MIIKANFDKDQAHKKHPTDSHIKISIKKFK